MINANLILGNSADAGSGGGVRLQHVNGNDVINLPNRTVARRQRRQIPTPRLWNRVTLTNNIIVNNVAGWDGGGVSLQDALYVNIVNNTIASQRLDRLGRPAVRLGVRADVQRADDAGRLLCRHGRRQRHGVHEPGLLSRRLPVSSACPTARSCRPTPVAANGTNAATALACPGAYGGTSCWAYSAPLIFNDLVWQNRSFVVTTLGLGTGNGDQQQVVTLMNADPSFPTLDLAVEADGRRVADRGRSVPGHRVRLLGPRHPRRRRPEDAADGRRTAACVQLGAR